MSYPFIDGNGSVQSADSSIIATGVQRPIVYIAGSVITVGSVVSFQGGQHIASISGTVVIASIVGTFAEDSASATGDPGIQVLGVRNDTISSLVSANGDYGAFAQDSAGRQIIKPFAPEESRLSYTGSVVSGSVTAIFPSVIGLRNYLTDFFVSNTGSVATLVTFKDGSTSVLGYTIGPATSGSNGPGLSVPIRTGTAQDLVFSISPSTSVLYVTAQGYKAP